MELSERNADSRDEMVCPYCWHEGGLEKHEAFAYRYDGSREEIINGTKCPECNERTEPKYIEMQLGPPKLSVGPFSVPRPNISLWQVFLYSFAAFMIVAWVIVPVVYGPLIGDTGDSGSDETLSADILEEGDTYSIYEIEEHGTYTISPDLQQFHGYAGVSEQIVEWDELFETQLYTDLLAGEERVIQQYGEWMIYETRHGYLLWNPELEGYIGAAFAEDADFFEDDSYTTDEDELPPQSIIQADDLAEDEFFANYNQVTRALVNLYSDEPDAFSVGAIDSDEFGEEPQFVQSIDQRWVIYETAPEEFLVWGGTGYLTEEGEFELEPTTFSSLTAAYQAINDWHTENNMESNDEIQSASIEQGSIAETGVVSGIGEPMLGDEPTIDQEPEQRLDTEHSEDTETTISGTVTSSGEALDTATMVLREIDTGVDNTQSVDIDSDAIYQFEGVESGTYELYIEESGERWEPVILEVTENGQVSMEEDVGRTTWSEDPDEESIVVGGVIDWVDD